MVRSSPSRAYTSDSISPSYKGTPHLVDTEMVLMGIDQPTPMYPSGLLLLYPMLMFGCMPFRPGGIFRGIEVAASPCWLICGADAMETPEMGEPKLSDSPILSKKLALVSGIDGVL